ncbi:protein of unknown function [Candidatus Nitrosocosmicus franklandus]|uniref:Uncharacterized protein n=1 Tax=Candidatus Nitrosocosmicus franklandianus TaxID=1798806 RepID=A0A484IH51_9ARCH|nr:protein of unknown function [Candidatus Nitrosocosmicus franklandus]
MNLFHQSSVQIKDNQKLPQELQKDLDSIYLQNTGLLGITDQYDIKINLELKKCFLIK